MRPRFNEDFKPDITRAAPRADPLAISEVYTNLAGYAFEISLRNNSFFEKPPVKYIFSESSSYARTRLTASIVRSTNSFIN